MSKNTEAGDEFFVSVNDLSFACCRTGDRQDPAIILIRGLGTQLIEWSPVLISALRDAGLQVVVFDNRDCGRSSKVDTAYTLKDMAADVIGILDGIGIQQAHVCGISLGGMVAQLIGYQYPERVLCLFSVMSSSGAPDLPGASPELRSRMVETGTDAEAVIASNAASRLLFGSPGYPESEPVRMAMAARVYERCYCPEGAQRQLQAAMADGSRVERLREIRAPTLVIHGAEDPLLPLACGEDTATHIPGAQLQVISGMGHNIPDALAPHISNTVTGFIQRWEADR